MLQAKSIALGVDRLQQLDSRCDLADLSYWHPHQRQDLSRCPDIAHTEDKVRRLRCRLALTTAPQCELTPTARVEQYRLLPLK